MKNTTLNFVLAYFLTLSVVWAQGSGNSLRFNGTNQYASVPHNIGLIPNNTLSAEVWVKPNNTTGTQVILSKGNSSTNFTYKFVINPAVPIGAKTAFMVKNTLSIVGTAYTTVDLPSNQWSHLAGTWDGTNVRLYINGSLVSTQPLGLTAISVLTPLYIGNEATSAYFNGEIDEVRLWWNTLTQTQIRNWMCRRLSSEHPTYGTVMAYYNFDETSGSTINEPSNGFNGTLQNSPTRQIPSNTPMGDESMSASGVAPDLTFSGGSAGSFRVHNTTGFGATDGIYVYKVNGSPNVTTPPLTMASLVHSNGYFGVFKAAPPTATYNVTYDYSANPLLAASGQENKIRIAKRPDNSSPYWFKATSRMQVDTASNIIRIFKQTGTEYVPGFANGVYQQRAGAGTLLDFDGVNEDIDLGSFNELKGISQFTFACWVNPDVVSGAYRGILSLNNGATNSIDLLTGANGDNIYMRVGNGQNSSAWTANGTLPAGKWIHIAGVFDGTQAANNDRLKIYVNGVQVALTYDQILPANTSTSLGINKLRIGSYTNSSFFDGKIDEVSIWNSALAMTDVRALMCNKTLNDHPQFANLISYYRFDENVGSTLFDLMGTNDGTLQNMEAADWQNSTAPIGDLSVYRYDSGTNISLSDGSVDSFLANFLSLSIDDGIHIYKVKDAITATPPAGMASLDLGQHFGVFQTGYGGTYSISHTYRSAIYPQENNTNLALRTPSSATTYTSFDDLPSAVLNPVTKTLSRSGLGNTENRQFMIGFNNVPNSPSNLFAYSLSETSMKVEWQDNSTNETSFVLLYDTIALFGSSVETGIGIGANVTATTITGLYPNKVYYFKIVANSGGTFSAYSNIATAVPTLQSGKAGRFNGNSANHYSSAPYTNTWGTGDFTIETWVKPNTLGTGQIIFTNRDSGSEPLYSTGNWFNLVINSVGNVNVEFSNGGTASPVVLGSVKELTAGKWVHIAIVRNATEVKMYINGTLETSTTTLGINSISKSYNYWVGRSSLGTNVWNGAMDEIRVWSTERTAAQINGFKDKPMKGNEANLVHYWNFDENLSIAFDRASAGINLNKAGTLSPVKSRAMHPFQSPTLAADVTACGTVTLRWRKDIITDFLKYRIFRGSSPATVVAIDSTLTITDTTFTNTGVANGTYYYAVAGVDLVGQVGDTIVSAAVVLPNPAIALTVTNTNDVGCGSLREAMNYANSNIGKDTIRFNIAGAAPWVISVGSDLPDITDTLIIDGTTQPGWSATNLVRIKGYGAGNGLNIVASSCEIDGLTITDFNNGIYAYGAATTLRIGYQGKANIISNNTSSGITCDGNTITRIRGNSIYCNGTDEIVLKNGANGGLTAPTITSITTPTIIVLSGLSWGDTIDVYKNINCTKDGAEILYTTFVAYYGDGGYSIPALSSGDVITVNRTNASGTSPISEDATFTLSYCSSAAENAVGSHISRVQFNTIDKSSSCSTYTDYTSVSTTVKRYETYALTVDGGTCDANKDKYFRVFIDWNQDGNFSGTGEVITPTSVGPVNSSGSFTVQNITVPSNATLGSTRMRVVLIEDIWGIVPYIDACGGYDLGETEDYTINIAAGDNMAYTESDVVQASTDQVGRGLNNQKIIRIDVVTAGYENPVALEGFTIKTDGSTNAAADVTNYNLYYGDDFATATLVQQSTDVTDFVSLTNPQVLVNGFNRFWLSFDVNAGATTGNSLDARCTEVMVAGTTHTPTNTDPSGSRKIVDATIFTSATATQNNTSKITVVPSANQEILGVFIKTSPTGATINLTSLTFNTNGSTNPGKDIQNAKVWYTGSSPIFATTTQVGGTINSPNGVFILSTLFPLGNGENYFWLTYDIRSGANNGDVVDAEFTALEVEGTTYSPDETAPADSRSLFYYCPSYAYQVSDFKIDSVRINGAIITNPACAVYTNNTATVINAEKLAPLNVEVKVGKCNPSTYYGGKLYAWIDFNQNGNFNDTGEQIKDKDIMTDNEKVIFSPIIPITATEGNTRMRVMYSANNMESSPLPNNPCNFNYDNGETEDFTINILPATPMSYVSSTVSQPNVANVASGQINRDIIKIEIVTANYGNPIVLENLNLNTNGSTNPVNDIALYKLWKGSNFSTATLLDQNADLAQLMATIDDVLSSGINTYWLSYDMDAGASYGNEVDAECTKIFLNTGSETPTTTAPVGFRKISTPMSIDSIITRQANTSIINTVPASNQEIISLEIAMSNGAPIEISNLNFTTNGSNNPASDIKNAKLWYTGTNSTFSTTTQVGATYNAPDGSFNFTTAESLSEGINYFWLTYDVPSNATSGNVLDATCEDITIDGSNYTPAVTDPDSSRLLQFYCASFATNVGDGRIERVRFNTIDVVSPVNTCETYTNNTSISTNVQKEQPYNLIVTAGTCDGNFDKYYKVYFDWNGDLDFDDTNEDYMATAVGPINGSGDYSSLSVTIPAHASLGATRMRVVLVEDDNNISACGTYGWGETEDYTINILPPPAMSYISSTVSQPNLTSVAPGQTDRDIIKIEIATENSYNPLVLNSLALNTTSSTNPSNDIGNYKLWKGSNFSTATLLDQNTDITLLMTTVDDTLESGINTYWLSYDIASGATLNNIVDAECTQIYLNTSTETPTVTNPAGSRKIIATMTYVSSTATQVNISPINAVPATNQEILGLQVVMSAGVPVNITNLQFTTIGSDNPTNDIQNAKLWYTGTNSNFATTTQIDAAYNSPDGSFSFTGVQALSEDTNYFWVTYDLNSGALNGNMLDATCEQITINGTSYTPSITTPIGNRQLQLYCPSSPSYTGDSRINRVSFNTIDEENLVDCQSYTNNTNISTNVEIGQSYNLVVTGGTCAGDFPKFYKVFFDWNQDLDFDDADEDYFAATSIISDTITLTGDFSAKSILIPAHASLGSVRMRIVLKELFGGLPSACSSYLYGETEDYTINITAAPLACLSGNYTINSAMSTSGTNFQTFIDFANKINTDGVCDAVVVDVVSGSGPYTEQVAFNSIAGVSATNTVTINGNGETLQYAPGPSIKYVLNLNDADYITIDSLRILSTSTQYGFGIMLSNGADNNTIRKCEIDMSAITSTDADNSAGLAITSVAFSPISAGNNANNLTFDRNKIKGGATGGLYYGITVIGNTGSDCTNNSFTNNEITDFLAYGIYMANTSYNYLAGNQLSRPTKTDVITATAFNLVGGNGNIGAWIEKNQFFNPSGGNTSSVASIEFVYVGNNGGDASSPIKLYNNVAYGYNNEGNHYGFHLSGQYIEAIHNTILLDYANSGTGFSRGIRLAGGADFIYLNNNNIVVTRGAGTGLHYAIYLTLTPTNFVSNHNNYYVAGVNHHVGFVGTSHTTLNDWQTASSNDFASIASNPMFVSASDLHLQAGSPCINEGDVFSMPALDILENARLCKPDLGAYEYRGEPSWAAYNNVWIGCDNDSWNNPNNWNTGFIPNATQTVLIPPTTNNPTIDASKTARCKALNIDTDNGAIVNIDVDGGGRLEISVP